MRRIQDRDEPIEEVGDIRIAHRRVPLWLMVVIVGVVAWGLFYLLTYAVTETGTFQAPAGFLRL